MDKKKFDAEFANQLARLNQTVVLLGGHSRFLLMSSDRDVRIENVVKHAQSLKVLSDAYAKGIAAEKEAQGAGDALAFETEQGVKAVAQLQSREGASVKDEQIPGFTAESLNLHFDANDIGKPLVVDGQCIELLCNPFEQRVTLKSSDDTVLDIVDGQYIVKGAGSTTLTATLFKDGDTPGCKSEMTLQLDLNESELDGDIESEIAEAIHGGFIRPSQDYDLELELGKDVFIGKAFPLPVEIENPNNDEFEFESSDISVFEVDAQTGVLLPKAAGDAALHLHIGDSTDVLIVSIK